jgi:hypothetical protein
MLLSTGLPPELRSSFYERATQPMGETFLASLATLPAPEAPAPNELTAALAAASRLKLLVLLAPADGQAPAWQCDPAAFEVRRDNIEREYLTRASGTDREYNHLDLLLQADAASEVFPLIADWLARAAG